MIHPDLRGCDEHGNADMGFWWVRRDGNGKGGGKLLPEPYKRFYCRACRRGNPRYLARYQTGRGKIRKYHGTRCVNGHLKQPGTWVVEGGRSRCATCRRELVKRKKAA